MLSSLSEPSEELLVSVEPPSEPDKLSSSLDDS